MTKKQIRKYVLVENTIISVLSITTGILTGIIFSKLFFMVMEAFLKFSIPFNISLKALGLTALVFFILFEIISIFNIFKIRNKEIVEQIKSSRKPKVTPKFSKIKSILGVLLIAIGYGIAWIVPGTGVVAAMLPVIFIVIVGTYFIFTQFGIAVSNGILKNKNLLYKKTNMVAYSQMIFKLQDTAKVLFLAAILGAFTFSATEIIYSFFTEIPRLMGIQTSQDMAIVQRGDRIEEDIVSVLNKKDLEITNIDKINALILNKERANKEAIQEFFVISNKDYNALAKFQGRELLDIKLGEVVYSYPYEPLNKGNDNDFDKALKKTDQDNQILYTGINLKNWKDSYDISMEIGNELNPDNGLTYYSKVIPYKEARNDFGLILFIGFFISFLFFIASGSIIYFKLFNEIKEDAVEYGILRKIGITKKEINKIITKQIGIIFFLLFVVNTLHSFFALKSLSNMLKTNLFTNGVVVMLGYLVFQIIYFMAIRAIYIRSINYN